MIIKYNGKPRVYPPKVGLALSGGGIRGTAHIGVLQALVCNHIPIDFISGTSAGAIIAALFACGYSPEQLMKLASNIDVHDLIDLKVKATDLFKHAIKWLLKGKFRFWSVLPVGLIKGEKLEEYISQLCPGRTVRTTDIPIAITAVDVHTASTVFFTTPIPGRREILNARYYHNTPLADAVRASISIPGIFSPKSYQNMLLVDGAVKNNLPTDILHYMGADVIIAIDLGYAGQSNFAINSVGEMLMQCLDIMGREVTLLKGEQYADIVIRPEVYGLNFADTKHIEQCIHRGERAVLKSIDEIRKLVQL